MRNTGILEKLFPSLLNACIVFGISLPLLNFVSIAVWKISVVFLFFSYNVIFLIFNDNRCLGMIIRGTYWKKRVSFAQELLYIVLYTLSFATLFIWIWFPFDIFIFNILFLQLPTILKTGTTFHGYLSGNKASMIRK